MIKNIIKKLVFLSLICLSFVNVNSQQVNTMYFMDNLPVRNSLNPAFQPYSNFYLGFPVIGYSQFDFGNNSLSLKDMAYKVNNQPITFLNANGNINNFYNTVHQTTLLNLNAQINLLNFGFRTGKAYWNFSLTERADGYLGIPKDLIKLPLYGNNTVINLKTIGFDVTSFTEIGLGYARNIDDKWSVGAKLKYLLGNANVSASRQNLQLESGINQLNLKGSGTINTSVPGDLTLNPLNYTAPSNSIDFLHPSGYGGGIDLGFTYKLMNNLTLSGAVTDLGFIHWKNNVTNLTYQTNYTFKGVGAINLSDLSRIGDSISNDLNNNVKSTNTKSAYTTYITPKLNIGAEYGFFKNKLTLGLLSRTIDQNQSLYEEVTASVNGKPVNWFDLSLSYSFLNGRMSNIGAGMALRSGILHWFVSADYIPMSYAKLSTDNNPQNTITVPYNTKGFNLAFGVSFAFGNHHDKDHDGVVDTEDNCPDTPLGVKVDKHGCPIDTDGDGVPDYLDKCPDTPIEAYGSIDANGCPIDSDGDGVPDYLDKCPNTPKEAIGFIDKNGCPLDTDEDGIPDYLDKCPNTPTNVKVDSVGCPIDSDGDGVPDYLDLCPNTPKEAIGMVDKNGCPLDSDGDGVPDYLDKCPNTPVEAHGFVDINGCLLDSDGDGVPDYLDKCPNTPAAARSMIDEKGCPRDMDGDGIPDYLDKCPTIPGTVANNGCPEVKKEVRTLFKKAMHGIQFETNKFVIKPISFKILNTIADVLNLNPEYLIEVQGHTDNVGKPASNLVLSEKRAKAVMDYLISKGVDAKRLSSHGFGDTVPVASNKTSKGKALNRRVEFIISFEKVTVQ